MPVDRVAERKPAPSIPEVETVEERARLGVSELQRPGLAAVRRVIDARSVAVTGSEEPCRALIERVDIAKLQRIRIGDYRRAPALAPVGRDRVRAAMPAYPHDALARRADGLKERGRPAALGRENRRRCRGALELWGR